MCYILKLYFVLLAFNKNKEKNNEKITFFYADSGNAFVNALRLWHSSSGRRKYRWYRL